MAAHVAPRQACAGRLIGTTGVGHLTGALSNRGRRTGQEPGSARVTENKDATWPKAEPEDEQDVEGNSLHIGSAVSADLARNRSRDLEREAHERARAKEAKGS
jgi:hypothetical protein